MIPCSWPWRLLERQAPLLTRWPRGAGHGQGYAHPISLYPPRRSACSSSSSASSSASLHPCNIHRFIRAARTHSRGRLSPPHEGRAGRGERGGQPKTRPLRVSAHVNHRRGEYLCPAIRIAAPARNQEPRHADRPYAVSPFDRDNERGREIDGARISGSHPPKRDFFPLPRGKCVIRLPRELMGSRIHISRCYLAAGNFEFYAIRTINVKVSTKNEDYPLGNFGL